MMSAETLLHWMGHMGAGHWGTFRAAIAELYSIDNREVLSRVVRDLRLALSDLGHADFFVSGSRRWRAREPALSGLEHEGHALVIGGRNEALCRTLALVSRRVGASLSRQSTGRQDVERLLVSAADNIELQRIADEVAIPFIPRTGCRLAVALPELKAEVAEAPLIVEPANWEVQSWSFKMLKWMPGRLNKTARVYINRHGVRWHVLHVGRRRLRSMDRYEAIYAAACHDGRHIVRYDPVSQELSVPGRAPLPERYSRAACLASGLLPHFVDGRLIYRGIPPLLASILLSRLGQPPAPPER